MLKYILFPGNITSKNDNQIHYISASMLIKLYKVNPKECIEFSRTINEKEYQNLIELHPRYDGNYKVINNKQNMF